MKLIAGLPCYNEAIFLDYAIASIYPYVDEVILTDCAMQSALDAGLAPRSTDGTQNIIDKWVDNKKVFFAETNKVPKTFGELLTPSYNLAREHGATWYFNVGADEIWSERCMQTIQMLLPQYERKGILGLNVWMWHFAPDFWHFKDFRNPRLSVVTKDSYVGRDGDAVVYPEKGLYQYAGDCEHPFPPGTPENVQRVNGDLPKHLRAFHYSCVGKDRVEFKVKFYNKFNGTYGDRYNEAYVKKDWAAFERFGFKPYTGFHPKIMSNHPLYNERLY